ncbi:cell division topological specificity factor MinE [Deinococcus maricopensis]|uniref:Cell division topological specificity factor MinE n=1 Tax=Deinococcus maricopensis (strain DSM 21211 / LMG 22137 / NRRL B-23946 / LB-34) TaxID=709986 RepID=E8U6D8_DEIML|nr:cell division topological specificity factor MinE [Deinococcus maricopensis]ADV66627.1 cell division topological specificity factor MinE [Deinococcus maricopensis DSM 21211]
MFWGRKRTKETLKDRLELVLAYDRAQIPPGKVDALRRDLMEVVQRYFPTQGTNVEVEQRGDTVVLVANIPLQRD